MSRRTSSSVGGACAAGWERACAETEEPLTMRRNTTREARIVGCRISPSATRAGMTATPLAIIPSGRHAPDRVARDPCPGTTPGTVAQSFREDNRNLRPRARIGGEAIRRLDQAVVLFHGTVQRGFPRCVSALVERVTGQHRRHCLRVTAMRLAVRSTTMICTSMFNRGGQGVLSPLDHR